MKDEYYYPDYDENDLYDDFVEDMQDVMGSFWQNELDDFLDGND